MSDLQTINRRVLVVDDNPDLHNDYRKILCPAPQRSPELARMEAALFGNKSQQPAAALSAPTIRFTVDSAHQGQQAAAMVRAAFEANQPYAVAFVDMRMPPGWDGLRTIREIWMIDPSINIVVCTAYSDQAWSDIESLAGESDRLLVLKKPFEAIEIRRLAATLTVKWTQAVCAGLRMGDLESLVRVRTAELEFARQEDRRKLDELTHVVTHRTEELRKAATHDELTGLPNRTLFHDRLNQAVERSRRDPNYRVAVLFLDFDRFKVVNDSLGHHAGDRLLQMIAGRLASALRTTDSVSISGAVEKDSATAARLGGDEFCVLLEGLNRNEEAATVATRLLGILSVPYVIQGQEVTSTASIGIAVSSSGYGRAEEMVRDADTAMYRAKAGGRGCVVMFDQVMHAQAMQRLTIEGELRRAIERQELRTFYQPVVSLKDGQLFGFEALIRWDRGERGVMGPHGFLDVAEESGFVNELGEWVLIDACSQMASWKRTYSEAKEATLSVNISPRQFFNAGLVGRVRRALQESGLEPHCLILEISESVLLEKAKPAAEVLRELKAVGIRVYLDDFGIGCASLSSLHQFPLDGLKIDRSLLRDGTMERKIAAVIYSITSLAHNLGLDVMAEGVESLTQVALLQSLECSGAQGYLFSPPVNAADAAVFLSRAPWRVAA